MVPGVIRREKKKFVEWQKSRNKCNEEKSTLISERLRKSTQIYFYVKWKYVSLAPSKKKNWNVKAPIDKSRLNKLQVKMMNAGLRINSYCRKTAEISECYSYLFVSLFDWKQKVNIVSAEWRCLQ